MRIPNKGTPWLVGPDGQVRPATQNEVSEIWFRWLNDIDARVGNIPPPTPPAPPPPFSANIQFQDDGVDVGLANPRYVSFDDNLTATFDAPNNRVHVSATGSEQPGAFPDIWVVPDAGGSTFNQMRIGSIQAGTIGNGAFSSATYFQNSVRRRFSNPLGGNVLVANINGADNYMMLGERSFRSRLLFGNEAGDTSTADCFYAGLTSNHVGSIAPDPRAVLQNMLGVSFTTTESEQFSFTHNAGSSSATAVPTGITRAVNTLYYLDINSNGLAYSMVLGTISASGATPLAAYSAAINVPAMTTRIGFRLQAAKVAASTIGISFLGFYAKQAP